MSFHSDLSHGFNLTWHIGKISSHLNCPASLLIFKVKQGVPILLSYFPGSLSIHVISHDFLHFTVHLTKLPWNGKAVKSFLKGMGSFLLRPVHSERLHQKRYIDRQKNGYASHSARHFTFPNDERCHLSTLW